MRKGYFSWGEYFMGVAIMASYRSKDPNTQVGSCIVNLDNKIIGTGYNGLPHGFKDDDFDWDNRDNDDFWNSKYPFVVHSEQNAIVNSISLNMLKDSTMYVTLFPCNECAKLIVQSGICNIFYLSDKYHCSDSSTTSRKILDMAGVQYQKINITSNLEYLLRMGEE